MIVNVDAPTKQQEILDLLAKQEKPKYTYLGKHKLMKNQLRFEVTDAEGIADVVAYTKGLIKKSPFGIALVFRVLEDGKFW